MRPPERIDTALELLKRIWEQQPDTRFFQLIYNMQSEYSFNNDGFGKVKEEGDFAEKLAYDFFYLEDDKFIDFLREKLEGE